MSDHEKEDLQTISSKCENIVVVLNTGGQVDVAEVLSFSEVKAILYMGQAGMGGGHALADILTGYITPSGKLADTWAKKYSDFPNADTFSHQNGNVFSEKYEEGIYIGYRYFDSFDIEPQYPFGFGLSYTDFSINCSHVSVDKDKVSVTVTVRNIGKTFSGKEVVQVYVSCPQNGLVKEKQRLCGFTKTDLLLPGESQCIEICFYAKDLASFNTEKSAWIVEAGCYILQLGNSSRNLKPICLVNVENETVIEQVSHICPLQENLEEIMPSRDVINKIAEDLQQRVRQEKLPVISYYPQREKKKIQLESKYQKKALTLVEKLTEEELIAMVIGEINKAQSSALGSAGIKVPGAAGETSSILETKWNVPGVSMADGPSGLRLTKKYSYNPNTEEVYNTGISQALEGGFFRMRKR